MRSLNHDILGGVGDELRVLSQPVLSAIRKRPGVNNLLDSLRLPLLWLSSQPFLHGRSLTLQRLSVFHLSEPSFQCRLCCFLNFVFNLNLLGRLFINSFIRQPCRCLLRQCCCGLVASRVKAVFLSKLHVFYFLCVPSLP